MACFIIRNRLYKTDIIIVEDLVWWLSLLAEIRTPLSATSILPLLKLNHRRSLYESSTPSNEHKRDVGACSSVALRPPPISRSRYYDLPVRNYYGQVYNVSFLSFSVKLLIRVQISNNTHNGKRMIIGKRKKKKEKRRKNCKIHYR